MERLLFRYFDDLTVPPQGQPNDAERDAHIFKQRFLAHSIYFPVGDKTGATDDVTDRLTIPFVTKQARYWHDACPATRHDRNGPATCPACCHFKH